MVGSAPVHAGVPLEKSPQSTTLRFSLSAIGFARSSLETVPLLSTNGALSEPVFSMSTVPVVAAAPGRMFDAVRIAALSFELSIVSVPAVKVLLGLALDAVKFAPDAPVRPTATSTVARAARARRGLAARTLMRDMGVAPGCLGAVHQGAHGGGWGRCSRIWYEQQASYRPPGAWGLDPMDTCSI